MYSITLGNFPILLCRLLCSKQYYLDSSNSTIHFCMDDSINEDVGEREVSELDVYEITYIIINFTYRLIKIPFLSWSI